MPKFGLSGGGRRRFILLFIIQLCVVGSVVTFIQRLPADISNWFPARTRGLHKQEVEKRAEVFNFIPFFNDFSRSLESRNHELPRNRDLFPTLHPDHITIVLYVHNRPQYLRLVVKSLSKVKGIEETLLIVSHDGFFPEMNAIIEGIRFCQVKQIFAPFSPHLFPNSFPGQSESDCVDKQNADEVGCKGNPDQYGNHRAPRIVSLKHHWWWMMNTVWDGLQETRNRDGHVLFIEEDHYILPNAYRTLQLLSKVVGTKCPECVAVNLAPAEVSSRGEGEGFAYFVAEKVGNVGYALNRTVWNWMHARSEPFCEFDDYNWDITLWVSVYPTFPTSGYTLRGPKSSAIHFGKCGLHQGQDKTSDKACADESSQLPFESEVETAPYLDENWSLRKFPISGYKEGFEGWGGWGDKRDQQLCVKFSKMYHRSSAI
ncbi:unnamed protein product [Calypogeia fissa]